MRPSRLAPVLPLVAALFLACGGGGGGSHGPDCGALTNCLGACVDTTSDPAHCGGCGACPTGAACVASECRCPEGQTPCGGACVDLQASKDDCGACGHACGLGSCQGGGCVCDAAPATVETCGAAASPECVDTASDPAHCGDCNTSCAATKAGSQCSGGKCQCLDPRPDACGSACTNLQTDADNCNTCGHVCPLTNDVCVSGACTCPSALPDVCGSSPGTCVSLATDAKNCGTCGHACPAAATCSGKACHCPAATPDLCESANTCVSRATDKNNCGACGNVCPAGATCSTSQCKCPTGNVVCGRSSGVAGTCCAGGCCNDGSCQLAHANGLGQSYYDCGALDEHTANQAAAAAQAWAPTGTIVQGPYCPNCLCASNGAQSAVWCYDGSGGYEGLVGLYPVAACAATNGCPQRGASNVFTWR